MSTTSPGPAATPTPTPTPTPAATPTEQASSPTPPCLVYLPSISPRSHNSTTRIAEILAKQLSDGPGTFSVASLDHACLALGDGKQILDGDGTPVLELFTVDYRKRLPNVVADDVGATVKALVQRLLRQLWYIVRALVLFVGATKRARQERRAKGVMARWQLAYGLVAVLALALLAALTVLAILAAWGAIDLPSVSDTWADVASVGLTFTLTWILLRSAPTIRRAATLVQQMLDYAQDEQQAVTVVNVVGEALDALIEGRPDRRVYLLGYSLGSLVAIDYLCPRTTQLQRMDVRHAEAVKGLITIGSPLDFVRLYIPEYVANRQARIADLDWTNVFIPADVLGSNMADDDDNDPPSDTNGVTVAELRPTTTVQFTGETLGWSGIVRRRGFLSHGGYWSTPGAGHCLNVVLDKVAPAVEVVQPRDGHDPTAPTPPAVRLL